jgi:hypothetical protein
MIHRVELKYRDRDPAEVVNRFLELNQICCEFVISIRDYMPQPDMRAFDYTGTRVVEIWFRSNKQEIKVWDQSE